MLMSVIEGARSAPAYPELAGKRVLITGLSSSCGVDIARAFADHKARLILQFDEMNERTQAIAEIVAPSALDIRAFGPIAPEADGVAQFARSVMQAFGGLDAVVNLVPMAPAEVGTAASLDEIERRVASRLLLPCLIAKIAANRMALSYIEGLILNVAMLTPPIKGPAQAFACVAKAALDRHDPRAGRGMGGQGDPLQCHRPADRRPAGGSPASRASPRSRTLALFLASGRGKALSGYVFEAEGVR